MQPLFLTSVLMLRPGDRVVAQGQLGRIGHTLHYPPLPPSLAGCALQLVNSTFPLCLGCWESDHIQVNEQGAGTLGCRCQNRYENPKSKLFSLVSGREPDNGAGEGGLSWYPVGCMLERGQQSRGCEPLTWRPEVGGCSPVPPITPSQGGLVGASEAPKHV